MAVLRSVAKDVEALRELLKHLVNVAAKDVLNLTHHVSEQSKQIMADALSEAYPILLSPYVQTAAQATASWYEDLSPESSYRAEVPVIDGAEKLGKAARWAVYAPGDATVDDRLVGAGQRAIFNASRQTVVDNASKERVRWARIPQADACEFCKVLGLRGPVYRSEDAASKGHYSSGHDHCYCSIVPVRKGTALFKPAYLKDFQQQYDDAVAALGAPKNYLGKNGYFKAVLAKMREQAKPAEDAGQKEVAA